MARIADAIYKIAREENNGNQKTFDTVHIDMTNGGWFAYHLVMNADGTVQRWNYKRIEDRGDGRRDVYAAVN